MADVADITGDRAEFDHLANMARSRRPEGPKPTGFCLFCGDPIAEDRPGARWCDADCARDFERFGG